MDIELGALIERYHELKETLRVLEAERAELEKQPSRRSRMSVLRASRRRVYKTPRRRTARPIWPRRRA
jgi:hypothetical protein